MNPDEKLVYMANQIASFFAPQGAERAMPGIADHLMRYWDPRMRRRIIEIARNEQAPIESVVRKALLLLRDSNER